MSVSSARGKRLFDLLGMSSIERVLAANLP